jgi:hypothetical protein
LHNNAAGEDEDGEGGEERAEGHRSCTVLEDVPDFGGWVGLSAVQQSALFCMRCRPHPLGGRLTSRNA